MFQLKELKEIYQPIEIEGEEVAVETDSVKVFVSLFSNIPYNSEETFYLPASAVDYLIAEGKLTRNEEDYWTKHTFNLTSVQVSEGTEDVTEIQDEENETISITGRIPVAEIIAMGIDQDTFQKITGLEIPEDKTVAIRDFFASQDLEFSIYKEKMESFLSN